MPYMFPQVFAATPAGGGGGSGCWLALRAAVASKVKAQPLRGFPSPHCCACSALTQELAVLAQGACFAIESVLIIAVRSASVIGAL